MLRAILKRILGRFRRDELMASPGRLLVGLGNPGAEYHGTRHNVGFDVIDRIVELSRSQLDVNKDNAISGSGRYQGRTFVAAKPLSYMNRSGSVVKKLLNRHRIDVDSVLIIVDDLNIPFGSVRIRQAGGAGGHNGLQDIIDELGTDRFARLRVGVGDDFGRGQQVDHVLSRFDDSEMEKLDEIVNHAARGALTFVSRGVTDAMNRFNLKPESE
ncbi:MAG: aminoacyl-tRNA hydrolase [Rhodothermales bacterium]|nr:aminoacyl-tRNA hydrolase [Rhodothermales bacterium]